MLQQEHIGCLLLPCTSCVFLSGFPGELHAGRDIQSYASLTGVSRGEAVEVTGSMSARLRSFVKVPRNAVMFFTQHQEYLAWGLLCPKMYAEGFVTSPALRSLFRHLFGTGVTYARGAEVDVFM